MRPLSLVEYKEMAINSMPMERFLLAAGLKHASFANGEKIKSVGGADAGMGRAVIRQCRAQDSQRWI